MDNQANFGLKDDVPKSGRGKPRGKQRKPYIIDYRVSRNVSSALARTLKLRDWWIHSRYPTASRRDQAYEALVKKAVKGPSWWQPEYRKRDPDC
jgi:hypothetical protein